MQIQFGVACPGDSSARLKGRRLGIRDICGPCLGCVNRADEGSAFVSEALNLGNRVNFHMRQHAHIKLDESLGAIFERDVV